MVLNNPYRFGELFDCYSSSDEVVRLRTSSAMKRVEAVRRDLLVPYINRLINEIGELDQASAQWTLARLFDQLKGEMTSDQRKKALLIMQRNLAHHNDWIVLNTTMETLYLWSKDDPELETWLTPHLQRLTKDKRKSVSKRAEKYLALID